MLHENENAISEPRTFKVSNINCSASNSDRLYDQKWYAEVENLVQVSY